MSQLQAHFKLRDLGPTQFLLGIEIAHNIQDHSITLSQRRYCLDMLERFGMAECNLVHTPMNLGSKLSASMSPHSSADREFMKDKPYRNAVGAVNYLATTSRPDISYTVGKLARFSADPGPQHWKALCHLMRYIKGSLDAKLVYKFTQDSEPFVTY